jgi:GNAT superfamily N-acetyltransferase
VNARDIVRAAVEVRAATEADLPAILALYGQPALDDGKTLEAGEARSIFARFAAYPDYRLYVARIGAEVVGTFALLIMHNLGHLGAPSAIVEDVAVAPEWQSRGVGRVMMEFAMQRSREARCYKLALSSNRKRTKAHRFYEALGFRRHGYSYVVGL